MNISEPNLDNIDVEINDPGILDVLSRVANPIQDAPLDAWYNNFGDFSAIARFTPSSFKDSLHDYCWIPS